MIVQNNACADSDWALQLYDTFNTWFENNIPKHRFICERIESPTAVFTGMMKYNGVLFDTELMEQKKAEAEAVIMLSSHFYESRDGSTAGFYNDNPNAANQVWNTVNLLLRLDRRWLV